MKTIKELADELGVSKTTIRKRIANLELQTSLRKNGNQFAIDDITCELVKQSFIKPKTQTKNANQTETSLQSVCDILVNQLDEKDKQIQNLQRLLDQEQRLHMATKEEVKLLESKSAKKGWFQRLFEKGKFKEIQ